MEWTVFHSPQIRAWSIKIWEAIRSRFGGNDESKKMQKYILKQQFEGFSASPLRMQIRNSLGLYLLPGLKFPSPIDDLYNNLRVFENDVKGSTASSSSTQNVSFVSENTSSTNDVSTAYGASNPSGRKLQFDAKEPVGFDKTKVECYSCHKTGHFARECRTKGNQDGRRRDAWNSGNKDGRRSGKQEDSKALVTIDGEGSDTEVISCSKECKESYAKLKKLYDEQRAQLSDASIEIKAYTQALKKVEAQLVAHQQGQLWYEEKIRFMKIDLDDKTDVLTYHKKLLAEAEKEKEDLKAKVEKWHNSSKNLGKLLNTQMSANDKFGLDCSVETHESLPEPTVNEPKVVSQPKVWSDAPIIEEYESDSEDEHVSLPTEEHETPSFANQQVKTPRETVKNQFTHSKNPKVDKKGLVMLELAGPQKANQNAGTQDNIDAGDSEIEAESTQDYFVLPIWSSYTSTIKSSKANNTGEEPTKHPDFKQVDKEDQVFLDELKRLKRQEHDANDAAKALRKEFAQETKDLLLQAGAAKANGAVADFTNLEPVVNVSPIPTSRINSIHPSTLILGDPQSAVQTRSKVTKSSGAHAFVSYIQKQRRNNHKDFQHCLFACFLSQNEPKKISEALEDESWVDAMQEELLQFKIQKVWILVDLPYKKKAIGTK
ncbi:ribonuclease H-like domain-containing protein [Tanacetum coccineum]